MRRSDGLSVIQEYSEHASKIRDIFLEKFDEVVNAGEVVDKNELKRIVNIFRNYKYMSRENFEQKVRVHGKKKTSKILRRMWQKIKK